MDLVQRAKYLRNQVHNHYREKLKKHGISHKSNKNDSDNKAPGLTTKHSLSLLHPPLKRVITSSPPINNLIESVTRDQTDSLTSMVSGIPSTDTNSLINEDYDNSADPEKVSLATNAKLYRGYSFGKLSEEDRFMKSDSASVTPSSVSQIDLTVQNKPSQSTSTDSEKSVIAKKNDSILLLALSWLPLISTLFVTLYIMIAMKCSSLFIGFACGCFLTHLSHRLFNWLLTPDIKPIIESSSVDLNVPEYLLKSQMRKSNESHEAVIGEYQGWLNLYKDQDYQESLFHISRTETVFANLEGCTLLLKKPVATDIPKKSSWNEPAYSPDFTEQFTLDTRDYLVELFPENLPDRSLCNKKYPIGLVKRNSFSSAGNTNKSLLDTDVKSGTVYLFARTSREKEEWFRRLKQASQGHPVTLLMVELQKRALNEIAQSKNNMENSGKTDVREKIPRIFSTDHTQLLTDYMRYMMAAMCKSEEMTPSKAAKPTSVNSTEAESKNIQKKTNRRTGLFSYFMGGTESVPPKAPPDTAGQAPGDTTDTGTLWVNALLQRVFFDFFRDLEWTARMRSKVQKRLDKLEIPHYISPFVISNFHLGRSLPLIKSIRPPYLSDDGLWIDSEIFYDGHANMTIETKINLNSLKKTQGDQLTSQSDVTRCLVEEEDESDDSKTSDVQADINRRPKKEDRLTKLFDSLKESSYFQKLVDTRLVKSALDKVSNLRLSLSVEIKQMSGIFCANILPPPTERIWFGFREPPNVVLIAQPVVGEKSVSINMLTSWIEQKLITEIQRELTLPNMVDFRIKLMCGQYRSKQKTGLKVSSSAGTTTAL